ncbi:uncharacterized protein K489DRAFT_370538 [Dissoconium aciculare CBS 342.82]|uniref:Uncharacterized protein n=1 Tax=Dissoconium aciculare CBS 342.82 TaxID=1314786 RepID=A0A6J3M4H5_9PEZI|nr:uncharacterized protein K489DRAFT_370538 [Dissoconium aciculare CBS 342.82]KAF1822931.1 hypothetical protein K489DRAFT_370538 [Dissoconium aciculare CBS 342.82]
MQDSKDEKVIVAADEIAVRLPIAHGSRQSNKYQWFRRLTTRGSTELQRATTPGQVEAGNQRNATLPQHPAVTAQRPTRHRDFLFEPNLRSAMNVGGLPQSSVYGTNTSKTRRSWYTDIVCVSILIGLGFLGLAIFYLQSNQSNEITQYRHKDGDHHH